VGSLQQTINAWNKGLHTVDDFTDHLFEVKNFKETCLKFKNEKQLRHW
jgi:hypothetical protein